MIKDRDLVAERQIFDATVFGVGYVYTEADGTRRNLEPSQVSAILGNTNLAGYGKRFGGFMSSEMIERVAKAIFDAEFDFDEVNISPWPDADLIYAIAEMRTPDDFRAVARAAIAAMRQPTEEMALAGQIKFYRVFPGEPRSITLDTCCSATNYTRMIDAALK